MRAVAVATLALALAESATAQQAQTAPQPVRSGVSVSRDTVTIGEPFEVRVRVRAPADAEITFPDNPDTAGTVQARDPRTITVTDSVQARDEMAIYHLAAWDVGDQPIRIGNVHVVYEGATGVTDRPIGIGNLHVFVRSVLPADSALRVPKPARPLWEIKPFPWWILALIAAAIAIGLGVWWWIRRRRRRPQPVVVVDPYARALREFNRLEAMGLVDAGERTRFVALAVEVLRDYLAARHPDASLALTSRELVGAMRKHATVSVEQLSRVLHEADLAKFAAWSLNEERARALAREARALVEHEHQAAERAAAAAQIRAAA